jgi:hypothetical protein
LCYPHYYFQKRRLLQKKFQHFKINGNWACANVITLKNNVEYGDPRWGLFKKISGRWEMINWPEGIDIQNDFELIDLPIKNGRIANQIVRKYPSCSMSIFGN